MENNVAFFLANAGKQIWNNRTLTVAAKGHSDKPMSQSNLPIVNFPGATDGQAELLTQLAVRFYLASFYNDDTPKVLQALLEDWSLERVVAEFIGNSATMFFSQPTRG